MSYLPTKLFTSRRFRKIIAILLLTIIGSTVLIVPLEAAAASRRITNYFDAFYWVITTVATVGFGDMVPVTVGGKLVALLLEIVGTSLFSIIFVIIGATIAQSAEHFHHRRTQEQLEEIQKTLDTVQKHLTHLTRSTHPGE